MLGKRGVIEPTNQIQERKNIVKINFFIKQLTIKFYRKRIRENRYMGQRKHKNVSKYKRKR